MRKIYKVLKVAVAASLLSGLVVSAGCTREETLPAEAAPQAADPDYVSVESALAALARFEADDPATRAEDASAVAHVDVLMRSDVAPATRTAVAAADAPLCYIAQFEGGGYAILGADVKQGGVIAYVPKGTLTAADLAAAKAATDRGEDYETHTYIHACMVDYLEAAADGLLAEQTAQKNETVDNAFIEWPFKPVPDHVLLLKTTWHQDSPFNDYCFTYNGKQAKVGCTALALGQILAYNKKMYNVGPDKIEPYNGNITVENTLRPNWDHITKAIETATPVGTYLYAIQRYLAAIGSAINMEYGVDESTASSQENVPKFLKKISGYSNVEFKVATIEDIRTQLRFNETPVYARGTWVWNDKDKNSIDHAWVIDGWEKRTEWFGSGGGIIGDTTIEVDYVYCRYGYRNAQYDGWIKFDILTGPRKEAYRLTEIVYYTLNY